jgi:CubicO group peptidase (beta-lactamase class C family)
MRTIDGLRGAALVTRAGRVVLETASGPAGAQDGPACTPATRFQIASVSKQFTAAAALLLAEAGQLDLAEPVARWLPGSPPHWRQVTLHHLLTHTAGVRHWGDAPGFDASRPMAPAERVALMLAAPLLRRPGTGWRYSSPGYLLAGHIVAQASGRPYARFLTEAVLGPLGLAATTAGDIPAGGPEAHGHRGGQPVAPWPVGGMPGTGDVCSTVGDLAAFTAALHSGRLLRPRSWQAMTTPHAAVPASEGTSDGWITCDGYGYGLFIARIAGQPGYFHPGDNPGYVSLAAWLPGPAVCVVILANDENVDVEAVARQLVPAALAADGG